MTKKRLPDNEEVLKHLLTVVKDCLNFMAPAVRQLEYQKKAVATAVLENRFDGSFFQKVHDALTDRLAQGRPSYTALLPYLEPGRLRAPLEMVEKAKKELDHRIRTEGGTESDRRLHLGLSIWDVFEKVGAARSTVEAVQDLQHRIIEKLSSSITKPAAQPATESQPATPTAEAVSSDNWFHDEGQEPPPEFVDNGPIEGQKQELCRWAGPMNDRTFTDRCKSGVYWVRSVKWTVYQMWFRNHRDYALVNSRRLAEQSPRDD
jgi:hypothetical protein